MLDKVKQYLVRRFGPGDKLLLGLSGGPDSMALFFGLHELGYKFLVAHVDHGLREESLEEAAVLEQISADYSIPFHIDTISDLRSSSSNLEDVCRERRLRFFKKVYVKEGCSALILGHHDDDQVETVLKRIFEGSWFSSMCGIKREQMLFGMSVIRPMLGVSKHEIIDWLNEKEKTFFLDKTNSESIYLRSRMRVELIPSLEKSFGKKIRKNILELAHRSQLVDEYLNERIEKYVTKLCDGPFGFFVEIDGELKALELYHLILTMAKRAGLTLSRDELHRFVNIVLEDRCGKLMVKSGWRLIYEFKKIFLAKSIKYEFYDMQPVVYSNNLSDWKDFWKSGRGIVSFPYTKYTIEVPSSMKDRLPNGYRLGDWYAKHKVPKFLRSYFGVMYSGKKLIGECLTGFSSSSYEVDKRSSYLLTLRTM